MILKYFTSNYDKQPTSNIAKVTGIISSEVVELKELYNTVELYDDVDKATGKSLDLIGRNILQYRGGVTDEIYRALIKTKIARDRSDGTYNNILQVLSMALNIDKSTLIMEEVADAPYPCIRMTGIPADTLSSMGMTTDQLIDIIDGMISAGIKLLTVTFEGTFAYVEELISSAEFGFAEIGDITDLDNNPAGGTAGGTFGEVYSTNE